MVKFGLATKNATTVKPIAMIPMRYAERIALSSVAATRSSTMVRNATTAIKQIPTAVPILVPMPRVVMALFKAMKNVTTQTMSMMMPVPMDVPKMCVATGELIPVRSAMVVQAVTKILIRSPVLMPQELRFLRPPNSMGFAGTLGVAVRPVMPFVVPSLGGRTWRSKQSQNFPIIARQQVLQT